MDITKEDIEQLKRMYLKHYHEVLTDDEAFTLGIRLVSFFKVVAQPIPVKKRQKRIDYKI